MRFAVAVVLGLALGGCAATSPGPVRYDWGGYDAALYRVYEDPDNAGRSVSKLQEHVAALERSGRKVPPGLYADLGSFFLQNGNRDQARVFFQKERDAWPDSAVLMEALAQGATASPLAARPGDARADGRLRSILVVPAANRSRDADAANLVTTTLPEPLVEKGYYVFPVHTARLALEEKGVRGAEQARLLPASQLAGLFGADAVLFVTVNRWDRENPSRYSPIHVDVDYRLVDREGREVWSGHRMTRLVPDEMKYTHYDVKEYIALVPKREQVAKSVASFVPLALVNNSQAFNGGQAPLPNGPYAAR